VEVGGDEPHLIMNPPDETLGFNHDRRSKRPRITPRAAYTNHIVPRRAHSPLVRSPSVHLPPQEDEEWDDSLINRMDPPEQSLEFDHGGRSKRRRTTSTDHNIDGIIPRPALSPLVCSPSRELSS
jgi:hypothetical protein